MKRVAVIAAVLGCAAVVAVLGTAASDDGGGAYKVRAIFDSAFAVIPGEDVKVAGVKVGKVESLDVTPDKKAAVVLRIDQPGFGDFRQDATCIIRPQGLIGEKFVECTPTQPRAPGQKPPPALKEITSGDGRGEHLLPVTNTERNVDLDLINDIYRLPERQRLSIILNELGTGLAGRGQDLNDVIRRANPALKETDKVLAILKQQNQVLADLARDSDTVLQPLAQRRDQVADFIVKARDVSQATAERRGALEQNLQKLPAFLAQLRPTLQRLGGLSDQMTPVLTDLGAQADNINRLIRQIGPLSQAARPAVSSLGDAAKVGTDAMVKIRPITGDVRTLARSAAPLATDLSALLTSFRDTGGIERLMDYLFFQTAAINGFDSTGHYLRAGLLINTCSTYATSRTTGCLATWNKDASASAASANDGRSIFLKRQDALLHGMSLEEVLRRWPDPSDAQSGGRKRVKASSRAASDSSGASQPLRMPAALLPSGGGSSQQSAPATTASGSSEPAASGGESAPAAQPSSPGSQPAAGQQPPAQSTPTGRLLDYLLGGGA